MHIDHNSSPGTEKPRSVFDQVVFLVILVNSVILFLQESGVATPLVNLIDALCTVFFIVEMIIKVRKGGFKKYWSSNWNKMDFILVVISLPSLIFYIVPSRMVDLSVLLMLRILRVFRISRIVHIFPSFPTTMKGFARALKASMPIFAGFLLLILVVSLFNCAQFKEISPRFFGTPLDSIYSTFRLCTVEGWYEIPDSMSVSLSPAGIIGVRIYFVVILVLGGIIGLSLVNSIFVNAMISNNNNYLEYEVKDLNKKIEKLTEEIKDLKNE